MNIQKEIDNEIDKSFKRVSTCPYCNCNRVIKHGKMNGIQRYRCKDRHCGRTFNENYHSPFRYSKKFKYMWKQYYDIMQQGASIRSCAGKMKINIITAFFWRHRFLNSFVESNKINVFKEHIELSKMIYTESFKGCKNIVKSTRDRISIVSIMDCNFDIESIPIERNTISMKRLIDVIYPKIHKDAVVIAYQDARLNVLANKHNANIGKEFSVRVKRVRTFLSNTKVKKSIGERIKGIQPIDPMFSVKLKRWISKFRGVATKYIDHYLKWFINIYLIIKLKEFRLNFCIKNYLRWRDIKGRDIVV